MAIKKMVLASAMGALIAFSSPAGAQANQWYTDTGGGEVLLGSSTFTGDEVSLEGEISVTAGPGGVFRTGPCRTTMRTTLWNQNGQATGEATSFTIFQPCGTNIPGCEVQSSEAGGFLPWHINVFADWVSIEGTALSFKYNDGCTALGIPPGIALGGSGTMTGTFDTFNDCIDFTNSGDLAGALGPMWLDGTLCREFFTNTLTLK